MIIDLRSGSLRKVKVGTKVITSKGFSFTLVSRKKSKESWRDDTSGLVWHDREDKRYKYAQALKKFKETLPNIREFEQAEKHGFREVIPNMKYCYWSASLSSHYAQHAQGFYGGSGDSYDDFREYFYSVRCVSR